MADCPLVYSSPNALAKRDGLGTAVLPILAGHWRSAHITALPGDEGQLTALTRVVSEDAVRRGLDKIEAEAGARWLDLPPRRYGAAAADRAPGVSTSTRRSSRFTATRRVPWSATIR